MERLREARILYDFQCWTGSVYLAGRAVEAVLRGLLRIKGRAHEAGRDLLEMLKQTPLPDLDMTGSDKGETIFAAMNELAVVWRNDLRFTGDRRFRRLLNASGRLRRIGKMQVKGNPLKANAKSVLEASERVLAIGAPLCQRSRKN